MTVMAAEAASTAGRAAVTGGTKAAAGQGKAAAGKGQTGGGKAGPGSRSPGPAPARPRPARQRGATGRQGQGRHRAPGPPSMPPEGAGPQPTLPRGRYRRIVLAEFLAVVLLIGVGPMVKPRPAGQTPEQSGNAADLAAPLVRLTAACALFFILALAASGPRSGRLAAGFGGLVLAGTLLNATTTLQGLTLVFTGPGTTGSESTQGPTVDIPGAGPAGATGETSGNLPGGGPSGATGAAWGA